MAGRLQARHSRSRRGISSHEGERDGRTHNGKAPDKHDLVQALGASERMGSQHSDTREDIQADQQNH
jgi:hypothetical protein